MEEYSLDDPSPLLQAASDFAYYPGAPNDAAAKDFLDRFPLPVIINTLQTKADVPRLESALVACLERIFRTQYGAYLIPHFMPFVQVGLRADSQAVRCLACKTVTCLLEHVDGNTVSAAQLLIDYDIYPLLLDCLVNGDEQVATTAMDAIKMLASSSEGVDMIFPANDSEATHFGNLAARCSSLGRVRVLALIVKLFSISSSLALVIYKSNLLRLLEAQVTNTTDTLATLSVLELFYELAEIDHGIEFLSRTTLFQLLSSLMGNMSLRPILRSRAMMICGRLLSKEKIYTFIDESSVNAVITTIDGRLRSDIEDTDECESAFEALGQIGSTSQGAALLLSGSPPTAIHIIDAAFDQHVHGRQLAALHALGNILGETRDEDNIVLSGNAEESLRRLFYDTASKSSKFTPSGLFLSVLQQDVHIRLAAYRVLSALVKRPWCLTEILSKQEIINIVVNPNIETTKIGMEARYNCCKAIHNAFALSSSLITNPNFAGVSSKLQEAVSRGPYLTTKQRAEVQPVVMTAERF